MGSQIRVGDGRWFPVQVASSLAIFFAHKTFVHLQQLHWLAVAGTFIPSKLDLIV